VSVKITFLTVSSQLRRLFVKNDMSTAEMAVTKLFMVLGKDSDPFVQSIWRECCDCFKAGVPPSDSESRISLRTGLSQLVHSAHILTAPIPLSDGRHKAGRAPLSRPIVPPMPKPPRTKKWSLDGQRLHIPRLENDRL
jgi:hypothetical protein